MELNELTFLLQNPEHCHSKHITGLEEIIKEFPYFQAARALRLKALKADHSYSYNAALKKTAAYTLDRSVLFHFISSPKFDQNRQAVKTEQEKIEDILVFEPEEVAARRRMAMDEAISMNKSESERVLDPSLFEESKESRENSSEKAKKELEMGKPLDFNTNEAHSFSEWLQLTSAQPIQRENKDEETPPSKTSNLEERPAGFDRIDEFISKSPKIKPGQPAAKGNLAEAHTTNPETLMTETLAKVYLEQKKYKKAIQAYKILILKNPEKSGFFADQIRAIEKIIEHNTD